MDGWMQGTMDFLTSDGFLAALRASLYIIVGLILARLVSRSLTRPSAGTWMPSRSC